MPRITISLPDDFYLILKDYAAFMGRPPSTVASQCLMEMRPSMEVVSKAMKQAQESSDVGIEDLKTFIAQELARVTTDASDVTEQLDAFNNEEKTK